MSKIEFLWGAFCNLPFPEGTAGNEIRGICVTSVDTYAAGCISTFVQDGKLDPEKLRILEDCLEDLEKVMDGLNESEKEYFVKLQTLGNAVIEEVNGAR